ncbi:unnamed protein product [Oreochromis niloticus]|nr:unnamed protein product [Mustela putorius furo]
MFKCFICQAVHAASQLLITHLRLDHSFYPSTRFKLVCAQDRCRRQFSTYSGFKKHLVVHEKEFCQSVDPVKSACFTDNCSGDNAEDGDTNSMQNPETNSFENKGSGLQIQNVKHICASIIGKLQGSGMVNSVVSSVVNDLEDLATGLHAQVKHDILAHFSKDDPVRATLNESFENYENPLISFNTETKRMAYFREKWGIVEPVEIMLGVRFDTRRNKLTGTYDQVPVKETFIYIPILETIKFMCRNAEICQLLREPHLSKTNTFEDFCDGSYYKTHPLFSKDQSSLQIQLYYDDFETANPLGSKRTVHKAGALYFVLRNLPPKFNSALMNIHLVALFHTEDMKKYGFDPILQPLINDIKILECFGLDLPFSSEKVYGTICQITGDNLGMHTILGFTESFSARHFCRLCLVDKDDAQNVYDEDDPKIILRGKDLFEMHCNELQSEPQKLSVFGLKHNSTLNNLQFFHVCHNFSLDIMHDILEGVAQYEIKLLMEYLSENVLSKNDLLSRVYAFDYGYLERKNRPTRINLDSSGNSIGLNSMQTLCLVRNLPLIFGDLLPEGNPNWTLLLLLLQIINIIFSPSLTLGMTIHLKHLIIEHHVLFKQLYPNRNLIPKHHFMIHYPSCIRKIGPLIHTWSMRFEAKHKVFKNTVKNFKNVTKSLARKHQIFIGYHWETSPLNHIEYGPLKSFNLDREDNTQMFARALHAAPRDLFSSSWIKFSGTEYRKGLIICINVENEMPVFGRITTILLADSTTFFLVDKLLVDNFNEHFHAYRVFETDEKDVIKADNLIIYKPFDLQHAHTGVDCLYVVPLFYL